jgi:hypothetical protein
MRHHFEDGFVGFCPREWCEGMDSHSGMFKAVQTRRITKDDPTADELFASIRLMTRVYLAAPIGEGQKAVKDA